MIRETDLVSYLPDFMREYKEPKAALEAENPEFLAVWIETDRLLYNRFISTADEYGIGRYEKMMGIFPEAGMTLEERRATVLVKWNEGIPYTLRKLRMVLEAYPGREAFVLDTSRLTEYVLGLEVLEQDVRVIRQIKQTLLRMLPANMCFLLAGRYGGTAEAKLEYSTGMGLFMEFYPRQNLGRLYLDGTWKLDGSRELSGFRTDDLLDLYPVTAGVALDMTEKVYTGSLCGLNNVVKEKVRGDYRVKVKSDLEAAVKLQEGIKTHAAVSESVHVGSVSVTTVNILDGNWKLDGSRKLNGGLESL